MKTIMHIATILPYEKLKSNNILLNIAGRMKGQYRFRFACPVPYANKMLGLLRKKWRVYAELPEQVTMDGFEISGLRGVSFPFNKFKALSGFTFALMNKQRLHDLVKDVDLIHAHYIFPDGYIAYYANKRWGIPYVLTFRDTTRFLKYNPWNQFWTRKIAGNAKRVLAISEYARKRMQKYIGREIKVIPHGIEKELLSYTGIKSGPKVNMLSVGDLIWLKHFDLVIKALGELNLEGYKDRYNYTVFGDGNKECYLRQLSVRYKVKVDFKGRAEYGQIQREMAQSDVFIMPSRPESFGRVYLEAMAKGNAVIAAKDSGIDGLFADSREVLMVEPTVKEIKEKLKFLFDNPGELTGIKSAAFTAVRDRFTWETILPQYDEMYQLALKGETSA
jgi:glycosyltransferase involved in cell wall biosynthesis